ncbi:MAG: hypothetical protein ACE14M_03235 [Terriglobales bacterium]
MKRLVVVLLATIFALTIACMASADAVPNSEATAPAVSNASANALPSGTAVKIKLETPISTRDNRAGDTFSGRVTEPVMLNNRTVIPVGASLQGRVMRVSEPRRIKGRPSIDLHPESVTLPNGERLLINAVIVDTDRHKKTSVNDEGRIIGSGRDGKDNRELAVGAGVGTVVGVVAGGAKGAFVGAGVGATATVVHWLTKRHSTELPAGTEIVMELSRPMVLSAAGAD